MAKKRNKKRKDNKANPQVKEVVEVVENAEEKKPHFWSLNLFNGILIAVILFIVIGWIYNNYMKTQSEEGWKTVQRVWDTTMNAQSIETNFLVRNLPTNIIQEIKNTLGDTTALPKEIQERFERLEDLPVQVLPEPLKTKTLRKYNIEQLEKNYKYSNRNNSTPWVLYTLAQLHFLEQNTEKALHYQEELRKQYPKHNLISEIDIEKNILTKEASFLETQTKHEKKDVATTTPNPLLTMVTSKGVVKMEIFANETPEVAKHFLSYVDNSFYNGLNFYNKTDNRIYTGCPLGNGKGDKRLKKTVSLIDIPIQKGIVVMETSEKEDEIDTRFSIFSKYPFIAENKRYCVLGKITDGMEVLESITAADILFKIIK